MIRVGSDFSGVGSFDQSLERLGIDYETVYACDMDKYARQTYSLNFGEPKYFPKDVYERDIPADSLDIYMTSPPCQSFSLAGKRLGKDDKRGILFFNSHEFIVKNKPRYFIFENVKGLLSDDGGKTFSEWLHLLGGKSVNGMPIVFPYDGAVPYHLYWKVLNAKDYGIPQNRERVFIIGIRDDADNSFSFPKEERLTKRLRDVLESEVGEKYYLSEKMMEYFTTRADNFNNGKINYKDDNDIASTITSSSSSLDISDNIVITGQVGFEKRFVESDIGQSLLSRDYKGVNNYGINGVKVINKIEKSGYINQDTQASQVFGENGVSPSVSAGTHGYANGYVKVKSATSRGFEVATEEDSINFSVPSSETRRGRVGKGVAQTLDTACNQGVIIHNLYGGFGEDKPRVFTEYSPTIRTAKGGGHIPGTITDYKIRRLTPRECFRLMDFNEDFIEKTIGSKLISDSQLYKQAGNSICVGVLASIISKLKL